MRVMFEPWFVKYKVDVVFAGHVHAYERSVSAKKCSISLGVMNLTLLGRMIKPQQCYKFFHTVNQL